MYLYDLNSINMYYSEDFAKKNITSVRYYDSDEYEFCDWPTRWIKRKMKKISNRFSSNIKIYNRNPQVVNLLYSDNNLFENTIKKSLNLNNISIYDDDDGCLNLEKLLTLDYNSYNSANFDFIYCLKRQTFDKLVNYYNRINRTDVDIYFENAVRCISEFVQENIIDEKSCDTKDILFKFIECLIRAKWVYDAKGFIPINLDKEYNNIKKYFDDMSKKYFDDTYHLADIQTFINYLDFKDNINSNHHIYNDYIIEILNILMFKYDKDEIVKGGYSNINYNNSIIKKILIILLIVVIIIIIVLIVLFIINKYKNNYYP